MVFNEPLSEFCLVSEKYRFYLKKVHLLFNCKKSVKGLNYHYGILANIENSRLFYNGNVEVKDI
jgi:hypothetical protein